MEFAIPNLSDSGICRSLLTLTFPEIILGIDNIMFITIASHKLSEAERPASSKARVQLQGIEAVAAAGSILDTKNKA